MLTVDVFTFWHRTNWKLQPRLRGRLRVQWASSLGLLMGNKSYKKSPGAKQWSFRVKCMSGKDRNSLDCKMKQWFEGGWNCRRIEHPYLENDRSKIVGTGGNESIGQLQSRQTERSVQFGSWVQNNLMSKSTSVPASPEMWTCWSSEDWECGQW